MKNLFQTVAIVTVFSVSEKFLGFLYRIFLSHSIGTEGIGIYQVALSFFGLLYTFCCSGVPVTVSRLMTKYKAENDNRKVYQTITAGIILVLLVSVPVVTIFYVANPKFAFLFADPRSFEVFNVLLVGLVFTSVYSVLRGVFWGNKDFLPYSIIELLEEVCMIVAGVLLITYAQNKLNSGYMAGVAVLISYVFSFSLGLLVFFFRKNKLCSPKGQFKPLLKSALPITAMRSANSISTSLVSILLPLRLISAGYTEAQAMSAFGATVGQALPLLFIPTDLIGSFTLVLIPEIADNYYSKNHRQLKLNIEKAVKISALTAMLFIPVFIVCGEEIGVIVFGSHECGKHLTVWSFLVVFMSLSSITTGMLNSMGQDNKTLMFFVIGGALMLACVWFLPSVLGIYSLTVGFTFVYGLTTILNLLLIKKHSPEKPVYKRFLFKCSLLILPTIMFGAILEKILLVYLGTFFTLVVCGGLTLTFNLLLLFGFNLIDFKIALNFAKFKLKRTRTVKTLSRRQV